MSTDGVAISDNGVAHHVLFAAIHAGCWLVYLRYCDRLSANLWHLGKHFAGYGYRLEQSDGGQIVGRKRSPSLPFAFHTVSYMST